MGFALGGPPRLLPDHGIQENKTLEQPLSPPMGFLVVTYLSD
jgi:hypothetical protein